jgi:ACS family tartrate transporter-like MFS transporter
LPLWGLTATFWSGRTKAVAIATINAVGNLGGFFGPYLIGVVKNATGSFRGGLYCVAGFLVLSACLMLVMVRLRPIQPPVGIEELS